MGILYVVATPIGNKGDLGHRAMDILKQVSVVFCEDTRETGMLLSPIRVVKPRYISVHAHNERQRLSSCLEFLSSGDAAFVSDRGTPALSDPGAHLVHAAREAGFSVVPIPGPSAVTTLLSVAGGPTSPLVHLGFPPIKRGPTIRLLQEWAVHRCFLTLFAGPHRMAKLCDELMEVFGASRRCIIGREMTKIYEEVRVGTLQELIDSPPPWRGEFTLGLWVGQWKGLYGGDPQVGDPQVGGPQVGDPQFGDPQVGGSTGW